MIRTFAWQRPSATNGAAGTVAVEELRGDAASAAWSAPDQSVWIDLAAPTTGEVDAVASRLQLHRVAAERAFEGGLRPRVEQYDQFVLLAVYVPRAADPAPAGPGAGRTEPPMPLPGERARKRRAASRVVRGETAGDASRLVGLEEVVLLLGARFLVTVHRHPVQLLDDLLDWWRRRAAGAGGETGVLVRRLLEEIEGAYFSALDRVAERAELLQKVSLTGRSTGNEALERQHMLAVMRSKRELMSLHRLVRPQRDALAVLAREGVPFYRPPYAAVAVSFEDAFDRAVRVDATTDTYHEMLVRARESYLTRISNELTDTANRLLVLTILVMVPLLVTGWYGMRFATIPELGIPIGHVWALFLTVAISSVLFLYLRRRGWA